MGQLKKVWRFVKRYITKYYIAFFCGGVVWMLLDVYAVKGIDASFVSAVADTLLVVFAFIALIEARKAWDDKLEQDSYEFAKKTYVKIKNSSPCFELIASNIRDAKHYIEHFTKVVEMKPDYIFRRFRLSPKDTYMSSKAGWFQFIFQYARSLNISIRPSFEQYYNELNDLMFQYHIAGGVLISDELIEIYFKKINEVNMYMSGYIVELDRVCSSFGLSLTDGDGEFTYNEKLNTETINKIDLDSVKIIFDKLIHSFNELYEISSDIAMENFSVKKYFKLVN